MKATKAWGVLWRSKNKASGEVSHLCFSNEGLPVLFRLRRLAREWIRQNYGYIANSPNLRAEPHGWRMPKAIRVHISKEEKA